MARKKILSLFNFIYNANIRLFLRLSRNNEKRNNDVM